MVVCRKMAVRVCSTLKPMSGAATSNAPPTAPLKQPVARINRSELRSSNGDCGSRGRSRITSESRSSPSANAGGPSVMMLTHRSCTAVSGSRIAPVSSRNPISAAPNARPSSMAATMVAKLSSISTRSATSRETSLPRSPIATPTSERLSAGASFTPSPVIATISPLCLRASTNRSLCSGATRALAPQQAEIDAASLRVFEKRLIERIAGAGLLIRVIGQRHRPQSVFDIGAVQPPHEHAVLGQRAGLVRGDYGHRTERFDGAQAAHYGLPFRHSFHAQRQRQRQYGRKPFRHCRDGQRDGEKEDVTETLKPVYQ